MSTNIRRTVTGRITKFAGTSPALGERQVEATISSAEVDRSGDIVVQRGIDFLPFVRTGSPILWNHDPNVPVAKAVWIGLNGEGNLSARAQFPAQGVSEDADRVYALIKAGIVSSTSIGFIPRKWAPLTGKGQYGLRFDETELVEFSFVATPANASATITGKRAGTLKNARARRIAQARFVRAESAALLAGMSRHEARAYATRKSGGGQQTSPPPPHCGRHQNVPCGMKDPSTCTIHGPVPGGSPAPPPNTDQPEIA